MLKIFKKLFKRNLINNDKGSALSVAFIVITVLTFSLTTVTSMNVSLAGSTTIKIEQVTDDSLAKGLIRQSIGEFEDYITLTDSYVDFNNVEIPRILADYGVVVTDVTGTGDFIDYAGSESYVYKFALLMDDGDTLYKYVFSSIYGSSVETFNVFDYSIGTNGKLILNGGYYDEVYLYGEEVKLASTAPYVIDGSTNQAETPGSSAVFPTLTTSGPSTIFIEVSYEYCVSTCFTINGDPNPFVINESNYDTVIGSDLADQGTLSPTIISDFFGSFDFDEYAIDYIHNDAPTDTKTFTESMTLDTAGAVILNNSGLITYKANGKTVESMPDTPFVDITNDVNWDFSKAENFGFSAVYDGDVTFTENVYNDGETEALVIHGDLTIANSGSNKVNLDGTFIVTGDLYFTGDDIDIEGTFFVFGQVFMNFNPGEGVTTPGNNIGFSLIAKDNIIIEEIYESHVSSAQAGMFSAFFYTEESIYIDAVNSRLYFEGSLFARALGVSGNPIFYDDESAQQINGIIVNSYRGYINGSGSAVPSTSDDANGFYIEKIDSANYQDRFYNIPVFESLIHNPGTYIFDKSEWYIE